MLSAKVLEFRTTTASAARAPILVPPKLTRSTPASVVNSLKDAFSAAAALESLAPSMCSNRLFS